MSENQFCKIKENAGSLPLHLPVHHSLRPTVAEVRVGTGYFSNCLDN